MPLAFFPFLFVCLLNSTPQALLSWVEGLLYKPNLNLKYQICLSRGETYATKRNKRELERVKGDRK